MDKNNFNLSRSSNQNTSGGDVNRPETHPASLPNENIENDVPVNNVLPSPHPHTP